MNAERLPVSSDLFTVNASDTSVFQKVFEFVGSSLSFDVCTSRFKMSHGGTNLNDNVFRVTVEDVDRASGNAYAFSPTEGMRLNLPFARYRATVTIDPQSIYAYAYSGYVGALPANVGPSAAIKMTANAETYTAPRNYDIGLSVASIGAVINAATIAAAAGLSTYPTVQVPYDSAAVYLCNNSDADVYVYAPVLNATSTFFTLGRLIVKLTPGATYPLPIASTFLAIDSAMTTGGLEVTYAVRG